MVKMNDVIIIGSGPAGLTAGIYTSRANLSTLIAAGTRWGGQLMLTTEVENFPGFPEGIMGPVLMQNMRKQAEKFGALVIDKDVTRVDFSEEKVKTIYIGGEAHQSKSVIIATGADTLWLDLPNEQKLIGRGVSSCAPCDAFFFKDKKVIVVGGGDAAMEEALVLSRFAAEVTIVHRRDKFRASRIMQDRVTGNSKIKVIFSAVVTDILGSEKVEGVLLNIMEKGQEKKVEMKVDGVFVAIGHKPNTDIFNDQLKKDERGYLVRGDQNYKSSASVPGVFVAGDVHDYHYRQAITAAAYGCEAAIEAEKWLTEKGLTT
ncbi:thioredoxin-disulfide reductase [Candidatus Woesebacteria bacterium]|nr:thioredoxin-disulfide reductase [Candidatus Woesebacteria bacterium]